ncbi:hemolysin III family protein [Tenacibaculum finnmarkense genomovar finnmarkense]|uniref:Hemolysin III family protein n=1 Tax=Tenacibaculum finnmarkense genomovar finnmarkense TaxID=1458503 RepID=A0AAP1RGQ8_9FLAO|nr:hemolysin III family protein [Tenacibaculum finnmarkense]MBE7653606.1 hemolysin III family protein [Tenacibaculum finnmarkense genomovar finnmarkense]MBE7660221.1 hemolysin III family protein [Tenacibaculum finnmarkense genomovar finnmarkense]MBE7695910.1 hemolysin III family protein [Tenacibaculum finnmarkense genomovar finnmarkense]MCD8416763.1 hemolysin III family protein [Tenacibaculum finnmarkense genomovar finnmarkense]MCD8428035.1 hemolysin III family protein [Tenacibaculum finnmarke
MSEKLNHNYSNIEEKLNVLTHGFGLLLATIALPFLILKSVFYQGFWQIASFSIFGFSLIILYAASTFYHAAKNAKIRRRLNIFDHAAIYVLIAGSYTPFCLVVLPEKTGWYLFIFVWLFALIGVILKLFFTGKFDKLSTALYLIMGWQVIFLINPLMENLPYNGLFYLIVGGVFYTIGAVLYSIKKVPYNHAIFHVFVLLGSFSHFWAIYKYV